MRVLIVNDLGTDTGGAERVSIELRQRLRDEGHEARLFTSRFQPVRGMPVVADATCFGASGHMQSILSVANPSAYLALRRLLDEYKPDIVHLRMFHWQLSPLVLACLADWPCLVHIVNYDLICPINTKTLPTGKPCHHRPGAICRAEGCIGSLGLLRMRAQRAIRGRFFPSACDRLITNSHWVRRRLELEGIRVDDVVWNGVATTPLREHLCPGPPTVGYAGRLVPKKGVDTLIRAFALVHSALPEARLLIAGEGESRRQLESLAHNLGIVEAVTFIGHLSKDDLHHAFEAIWVQAAPSRWEEPFGLVAAESMMRSTAVVTANTGGLSEQNLEAHTGYQVPPADTKAWAHALLRILTDNDHAINLGKAARRHAEAHLTFETFFRNILSQYDLTIRAQGERTARQQ